TLGVSDGDGEFSTGTWLEHFGFCFQLHVQEPVRRIDPEARTRAVYLAVTDDDHTQITVRNFTSVHFKLISEGVAFEADQLPVTHRVTFTGEQCPAVS